jgi:hypothetical protein
MIDIPTWLPAEVQPFCLRHSFDPDPNLIRDPCYWCAQGHEIRHRQIMVERMIAEIEDLDRRTMFDPKGDRNARPLPMGNGTRGQSEPTRLAQLHVTNHPL